eukprot:7651112-Ditylum_brightwellii.AAC.1
MVILSLQRRRAFAENFENFFDTTTTSEHFLSNHTLLNPIPSLWNIGFGESAVVTSSESKKTYLLITAYSESKKTYLLIVVYSQ